MGGRGGSSHRRSGGGGNLDRLTSTADVDRWLRNQGWFRSGSAITLQGVDVNAAKGIAKAFKQVFDRYPQLKGEFGGVISFALGASTYADCNLGTGRIRVSTAMYGSVRTLERSYSSDIRSNWHPKGTDWSAIVTHEIGHAIDGYISRMMRMNDTDYMNWEYNSKTLRDKISSKFGFSPTQTNIAREVSRYGATKPVEWFAESFAEGMRSSTPRRMAKEFMLELDEILRRIR